MPGSAPAGTIGTVGTTATVAPVAPDTPASPGSPLAEGGAANTRIRARVARAVAGAVDRRRDVVVVMLPPVCETAQATERFRERRPKASGWMPSTPPEVEPGAARGVTPGDHAFELEGLPEAPPDLRLARPRRPRPPHARPEPEDHHPRAGPRDTGPLRPPRAPGARPPPAAGPPRRGTTGCPGAHRSVRPPRVGRAVSRRPPRTWLPTSSRP